MDRFRQDLRFAIRTLVRAAGFLPSTNARFTDFLASMIEADRVLNASKYRTAIVGAFAPAFADVPEDPRIDRIRCGLWTAALVDPDLACSLPPRVTAYTGMDALTHAMEAYVNPGNTPFTRMFATDLTVTVTNSSLGLVAARLQPDLERAGARERQDHDREEDHHASQDAPRRRGDLLTMKREHSDSNLLKKRRIASGAVPPPRRGDPLPARVGVADRIPHRRGRAQAALPMGPSASRGHVRGSERRRRAGGGARPTA